MHIWLIRLLFVLFVSLTYFSSPASSATATHTYDQLNRLVHTVYESGEKTATIDYVYDATGNMLNVTVTANYLAGDVDGNDKVDLTDAMLCLQVTSGIITAIPIHKSGDIDGDGKIGTVEVIYILQKITGLQ